jgi:hypothetical protein
LSIRLRILYLNDNFNTSSINILYKGKGKGKGVPVLLTEHHAMKALDGGELLASRPGRFAGKSPRYPLDRRLDGYQGRSGSGGEEKNSQPLPGLEPPIFQPVVKLCTTELSRLLID